MKPNYPMRKHTKISKWEGFCCGALALASFLVIGVAQAVIPGSERDGLELLFRSTDGGNWAINSNWCAGNCPTTGKVTFNLPGTECSWWGVQCDANEEHVIRILLEENNLVGSLPELDFLLPEMQEFDVSSFRLGNQFMGAIPPLMGWRRLRVFNVGGSGGLSGSIPDLTGLTELEFFSVTLNQLSGSIPDLTGLIKLKVFNASFNQISGSIPSLAGLSALISFDVDNNNLSGAIPTLMGLSNLEGFFVANNQLTGAIPALDGLEHLSWFNVFNNELSGALPLPPHTLINGYYDAGTYTNITDVELCPGNGGLQHQGNVWIYLAWNKASGDLFTPWWVQDGGCN